MGHHGSAYSSSAAFIEAVDPHVAIVSVGRHNLFGHPAPITLGTLRAVGASVFRTDQCGAVTIASQGATKLTMSTMLPCASLSQRIAPARSCVGPMRISDCERAEVESGRAAERTYSTTYERPRNDYNVKVRRSEGWPVSLCCPKLRRFALPEAAIGWFPAIETQPFSLVRRSRSLPPYSASSDLYRTSLRFH